MNNKRVRNETTDGTGESGSKKLTRFCPRLLNRPNELVSKPGGRGGGEISSHGRPPLSSLCTSKLVLGGLRLSGQSSPSKSTDVVFVPRDCRGVFFVAVGEQCRRLDSHT